MKTFDLNKPGEAEKIAALLEQRTADLVKMAGIEFFRQVIISTPVDTGRARFGWYITVNAPSDEVPPEAPYKWKGKASGGNEYYSLPNISTHMDVGKVTINDIVYVTNNVPYVPRLNKGYSRQAPARFVELAAARVQQAINKLWQKIK